MKATSAGFPIFWIGWIPSTRSASVAGDVAFGGMSGTTMAAPRLQGADLVVVLSFQNKLNDRLVVRPSIRSPADLKGKRVGVAGFGLGAHRSARLIVAKLGLNPEKEVTLLQVGGQPTRLAALFAGSIDATVLNPPFHQKAVEGGMKILANLEEMEILVQGSALVTTQRFIAKNGNVVQRVVKSIVEGIHLIITNPELSKGVLRKYMRMRDEKELDEAYKILLAFTQRKPYPTVEGFKNVLDDLSVKVLTPKTANPRDFFDVRFLEELDRSGFIDALYR